MERIALAIHASSNAVAIALMTIAFFGKGLAAVGWAVLADTAPQRMADLAAYAPRAGKVTRAGGPTRCARRSTGPARAGRFPAQA